MKTIEELRSEYGQKCAELGNLVYQQRVMHGKAESIIRDIEALDLAALALSKQAEATPETPAQE